MDPIMRAHQRHVLGSPRFGANFLYLWALIHPKFGNYESRAIPIAVMVACGVFVWSFERPQEYDEQGYHEPWTLASNLAMTPFVRVISCSL